MFHQHCHPMLEYCSNELCQLRHELRSLRCEIGASPLRYRINKSSEPLVKTDKLTFTNICWQVLEATTKLKQPLVLSYCLSFIHCSHVTYLTHLDTTYQSSSYVTTSHCQGKMIPIYNHLVRKRTLNHLAKFNHLVI